jgi:hypothetical protein
MAASPVLSVSVMMAMAPARGSSPKIFRLIYFPAAANNQSQSSPY